MNKICVLLTFLLCSICSLPLIAQTNWSKDGNGIPDHVAINEFLTIDGNLYACGHYINDQFVSEARMYHSKDSGESWGQVNMSGLDLKTMNAVYDFNGTIFASGAMNAAGGMEYGVYRSNDKGTTWSKCGNGIPDHVAVNKFLAIDGNLYACGHYINEQFVSEARMYESSDNGNSWERVSMSGLDLKTMNAVYDFNGTIFASGALNAAGGMQYGVYCSSDKCSSWTKNGNGIPDHVAINEFLTINGNLYACGHYINDQFVSEARMYETKDNGNTWQQVSLSGLDIKTLNAVYDFNGIVFAAGALNAAGGMQYGVYLSKHL